jgi:hypothetical protein
VPRPPRDYAPGTFHLGTGASGPSPYFRDERDLAHWIRLFTKTARRYDWKVILVCPLTTHWHAIVETRDWSLPRGMHSLNCEWSKTFNTLHVRVGYLVRDRYWSRRKSTAEEILNAYTYAANNPVLAGLVSRAEDWQWSSFATTVGLAEGFEFVDGSDVLRYFGDDEVAARSALRQHVTTRAERALAQLAV